MRRLRHLVAVLASLAAVGAIAGCGGEPAPADPASTQPCLITASGAKLCGADAVAWCDATEPTRSAASDELRNARGAAAAHGEAIDDAGASEALASGEAACDAVR